MASRLKTSALVHLFLFLFIFALLVPWSAALASIFLATGLVLSWLERKRIIFEVILSQDLVQEKWGRYRPWDAMNEEKSLILGRLPLDCRGDLARLVENRVDVVISILEPFEERTTGLAFRPVPATMFSEKGLIREVIRYPDITALNLEVLQEGVRLIGRYLAENKKVYVHCKSGQGRSACLVAGFLLDQQVRKPLKCEEAALAVDQVISEMKQKRPQISLRRQKKVLQQYLESSRTYQ